MLRYAIIGIRGIGKLHANNLQKIKDAKLTAVCDVNKKVLDAFGNFHSGVERYTDYNAMLNDDIADVVIIATPHSTHVDIALACLKANKNIIIEKPLSVTTLEADKLVKEIRRHPKVTAAVMFNQRTSPLYKKAKTLIESGKMGEIQRVNFMINDWYRPQRYYDRKGWHGTFNGEGGGILIGLIAHQIDILQWLIGMPKAVRAVCGTKNRNITAENEATALLMYDNFNTVLTASCHEPKGKNRLEIVFDKGKLIVRKFYLEYSIYNRGEEKTNIRGLKGLRKKSHTKFLSLFSILKMANGGQQLALLKNVNSAILRGTPLISPAKDGINSVMLINAMYLSNWQSRDISLPIDNQEYFDALEKKKKEEKEVLEVCPT